MTVHSQRTEMIKQMKAGQWKTPQSFAFLKDRGSEDKLYNGQHRILALLVSVGSKTRRIG
jgi:hypothetical protein